MQLNTNVIIGVATIVAIGILVRFDVLPNQYASLALGTVLGAGAAKAKDVFPIGKQPPS